MRNVTACWLRVFVLLALALPAMPALAQQTHFVASTGSDNNPCTRAAPCRNLGQALGANPDGGSVICLDQGPYIGVNTLAQPGVIDCGGATVLLSSCGTAVFQVNNTALDPRGESAITLRNMNIVGSGESCNTNAIEASTPLTLDNVKIFGFGGFAIKVAPQQGTTKLHVLDSVIEDNGAANGTGGGINIQPTGSGSVRVLIERTQILNNQTGVIANASGSTGTVSAHFKESIAANNKTNGIAAVTTTGHIVGLTLDHSSSLLNGSDGIQSNGQGSFVLVGTSTVMSNGTGLHSVNGGSILSYGNNQVLGNFTDGAFTGALPIR